MPFNPRIIAVHLALMKIMDGGLKGLIRLLQNLKEGAFRTVPGRLTFAKKLGL